MSPVMLSPAGPAVQRIVPGLMNLAQWNLSPQERLNWIEAVLDLGLTTFDHADIYGSYTCEGLFGEALALKPSLRQQMQLVTKCGIKLVSPNRPNHALHSYDTTTQHIIQSAENSLKELRTDYLDVLLIHRPSPLMNPDEIVAAFVDLHGRGKVRTFGVSNFTPSQFDLLADRSPFPLVTNQIELSVMALDVLHDGTLDQCLARGIRPMAWSPLAGGSIFRGDSERAQRVKMALHKVGEELGQAGLDQVALAWILHHPSGVLPVLGTGKIERLRTAVDAQKLEMNDEQWFAIWEASAGHEVP